MKFSIKFLFLFLVFMITPIFGRESAQFCESSVTVDQIRLLKNEFEFFQKNIAFDPYDSKKAVTKYELYPNGWLSYGIYSDEVGISDDVLWSMIYVDEHGDAQTLRVNPNGTSYEVTHDSNVIAILSTLQDVSEKEVQSAEYFPVIEKMVAMYRSAKLFRLNLDTKKISGVEGKVTHYEIAPNSDFEFERDFTLKIAEKRSTIENFTVNGTYACKFVDVDKQMHGEYGSAYRYHLLSTDITLTNKFASAVM
ncbi:uncharacterized protein LOC119071988 [Bradysia coprophila]|uniref:uncharacterized protein LOC119071988 n=1 Tax=Bradysia coprophila TaxID=38358 RepID=UPI00187D9B4F|nr:uncharacterized protein LOC119071988 [Bradysia coprophila]